MALDLMLAETLTRITQRVRRAKGVLDKVARRLRLQSARPLP
jgi:hypothetical protein